MSLFKQVRDFQALRTVFRADPAGYALVCSGTIVNVSPLIDQFVDGMRFYQLITVIKLEYFRDAHPAGTWLAIPASRAADAPLGLKSFPYLANQLLIFRRHPIRLGLIEYSQVILKLFQAAGAA